MQKEFLSDQRKTFEFNQQKVYSESYATAYHQELDGMVERRMQTAVLSLGNAWYSAWVDAGQPKMEEW